MNGHLFFDIKRNPTSIALGNTYNANSTRRAVFSTNIDKPDMNPPVNDMYGWVTRRCMKCHSNRRHQHAVNFILNTYTDKNNALLNVFCILRDKYAYGLENTRLGLNKIAGKKCTYFFAKFSENRVTETHTGMYMRACRIN